MGKKKKKKTLSPPLPFSLTIVRDRRLGRARLDRRREDDRGAGPHRRQGQLQQAQRRDDVDGKRLLGALERDVFEFLDRLALERRVGDEDVFLLLLFVEGRN